MPLIAMTAAVMRESILQQLSSQSMPSFSPAQKAMHMQHIPLYIIYRCKD